MTSKVKRTFMYFGYVDVSTTEENTSKVLIVDNFSLLSFDFELNECVKCVDCTLNDCVFIFTADSLYALKHREETLFKIQSPVADEPTGSSIKWKWTPFEAKSFVKTDLNSIKINDQWSHWNGYFNSDLAISAESLRSIKFETNELDKKYFACTLFGAFIAQNVDDKIWTLQRIYDSRSTIEIDYKVYEISGNVRKICAGNDHIVLLSTNGRVFTCGSGNHAELGNGALETMDEPQLVEMFVEAELFVVDISVGAWHTCALTNDGDVYGWGWNSHGQLGYDTEEFHLQPIPYPFDIDKKVIALQCKHTSTFVILEDGSNTSFGECQKDVQRVD